MSFSKILLPLAPAACLSIDFVQQSTTIHGYLRDSTDLLPAASLLLKNLRTGTIAAIEVPCVPILLLKN